MRISEVLRKENIGRQFKDDNGEYWYVYSQVPVYESFPLSLKSDNYKDILTHYSLNEIVQLNFKEIVDWDKVPVDTKVLVKLEGKRWTKGYFAKYENNTIYIFSDGRSSFTKTEFTYLEGYKVGKLYKEGGDEYEN